MKNIALKRKSRIRSKLKKVNSDKPRLTVFRSLKNIYAQLIDDSQGLTVASASSLEKDLRNSLKTGADKFAAEAVGKLVAERALEKGLNEVVFDRGGYRYHGRVKALADSAREAGLKF